MFYNVAESNTSRERLDRAVRRTYVVEWRPDGNIPGTTTPDGDTVSVGVSTDVADSTPTLAREAVLVWFALPKNIVDGVPLRASLEGFPGDRLSAVEVEGSEGTHFQADASWGDSSSRQDRQTLDSGGGVADTITQTPASTPIVSTSTVRGGNPGRSVDFLPVRHMFYLNSYLDAWATENGTITPLTPAEVGQASPFPPGAVHVKEGAAPDGVDISAPRATRTVTFEIAGQISAAFAEAITRAADKSAINSDIFTVSGITYASGELCLAESTVLYSEGSTKVTLGLAAGETRSWNTVTDFSPFARDSNGLFKAAIVDEANLPLTDSASGTLSPFDYIWQYLDATTRTVGEKTQVVTTTVAVSVHRVFESQSFTTLFGGSSI